MSTNSVDSASAPIRVAYVIDNLRRDGAQKHLVDLVNGLSERGYEQRVYCLNDSVNAEIVHLLSAEARVVIVGKLQLVTLTGLARLFAEFRRWHPLIVQTFLPFGNTIGCTVAHLANVPIIASSIRARNVDKRGWQFLFDRVTVRWVDAVVFNSRQVIPFAIAKEGVRAEQAVYIPNGVKVEHQDGSLRVSRIRSELGITSATKVTGMVGRLYPQKGHHFLLTAFARVLEEIPDAVLLVVGSGPLRHELRAKAARLGIAGRVHFLGERADVPGLLACMDVYVQASLWEGMPNAVMEAMAAGKPVVATGVDGTRELITHGETGWLVEPSNAEAIADRIVYVLNNVAEAKCIGAAAIQRVATDFSVDNMISGYDRLYRGLAMRVCSESHGCLGSRP